MAESPTRLGAPTHNAYLCNLAPTLVYKYFFCRKVLHGDISQHQRDQTIKAFRAKGFQVLVATDVAARGIDVSDIDLVVQYRPPRDPGKDRDKKITSHGNKLAWKACRCTCDWLRFLCSEPAR